MGACFGRGRLGAQPASARAGGRRGGRPRGADGLLVQRRAPPGLCTFHGAACATTAGSARHDLARTSVRPGALHQRVVARRAARGAPLSRPRGWCTKASTGRSSRLARAHVGLGACSTWGGFIAARGRSVDRGRRSASGERSGGGGDPRRRARRDVHRGLRARAAPRRRGRALRRALFRQRVPAIYRAHDAFVFPSIWREPFGLTPLEAMACGVPVIETVDGAKASCWPTESTP
ncbi:MAG: glycosyltransferase [Sandaracinus sp.]|nr:glycosyltransferase [Sandaracinus sp.]